MPFETEHGIMFWDYASRVPKLNLLFNDVMARDAALVSSLLLGDEKWKGMFEGLQSLVDVGGGTGTMTRAIAKSFPEMSCVVFDLPHVVAGFQGNDDENLKYVGGNMFEAIPPCDAILLKRLSYKIILIKKEKKVIIAQLSSRGVGRYCRYVLVRC
ncbi:hypothetical protein PIB30_012902 [Stylosanthes scabra]|uniref:O-methyltransferase C-terminal domain-containing protein n=1 Tax=Stylosanthes scabra TaxID=79078 RepID=A0ABU6X518_9FABA|nr:hypothetical protein [Stylosanthes scabra]